ncbi:MAG: hypothetical protein JW818_15295 [Pirellulales bacterium]|nr:hypothetical protein [Pirellulales bacterium]
MSRNDNQPTPTVIPPGYRLGPSEAPDQPEGPAQFGLRGLLWLQLVFALFVAMLMAFGGWMILPLYFATILLRVGRFRLRNPALRRVVFGLLAGMVLPLVCLWYLPEILYIVNPFTGLAKPNGVLLILMMALPMASLVAWLAWDALLGRPNILLTGPMMVGTAMACVFMVHCGMVTLFTIGFYLPAPTAWAYAENTFRAFGSRPRPHPWLHLILFVISVTLTVAVLWGVCEVYGLE